MLLVATVGVAATAVEVVVALAAIRGRTRLAIARAVTVARGETEVTAAPPPAAEQVALAALCSSKWARATPIC